MERETQPCDLSVCPSFNSYSSAAEVAGRARIEDSPPELSLEDEEEDDFEFVSLSANPDGEFFVGDGEIGPIFPVFDGDLLLDRDRDAAGEEESIWIPLKKLFVDDRDPPSSSCSEADETERIAPGLYCFWTPKLEDPSPPRRCEKSNSTGSTASRPRSRWWRFRDLLRRSNSEGAKGSSLVFLTPAPQPPHHSEKRSDSNSKKGHAAEAGPAKSKAKTTSSSSSAHEKLYVRNRKMREEDKRRSYLPYRQDLVGFFANVNGAGRNFPPF